MRRIVADLFEGEFYSVMRGHIFYTYSEHRKG